MKDRIDEIIEEQIETRGFADIGTVAKQYGRELLAKAASNAKIKRNKYAPANGRYIMADNGDCLTIDKDSILNTTL